MGDCNTNSVAPYFYKSLIGPNSVSLPYTNLFGGEWVMMAVTDANVTVVREDDRDPDGEKYRMEMRT